jgi:hypothetical protein
MGRLTEEMTRLCGEIVALRGARRDFLKDLSTDVAALKADFRQAHHEMTRTSKAGRQAANVDRQAAVAHLKKTVGDMRHAFAADLEGARRAWAGK